jgi:hypothetical protein
MNQRIGDMKMKRKNQIVLCGIILSVATGVASAQQVPDLEYNPPLPRPAFASGKGPRITIDEAHNNFHTANGGYKPFAELLRRDGYRVDGLSKLLSADSLNSIDVLVIANPLHERNVEDWSLPTLSVFTEDEIAAVRSWVEKGGALFLIADHMPFPGAVGNLAKAFGVEFNNGFAVSKLAGQPGILTFGHGTGLKQGAVTQGRADDEKITEIATFAGSAFKPPKEAIPVLEFDAEFVSLTPEKVWKFTETTPRIALEGWCQGAVMKVGIGRVAVFGEATMFTAQIAGPKKSRLGMNGPEAKQNHQLLLNVMHWLTQAKGMPD